MQGSCRSELGQPRTKRPWPEEDKNHNPGLRKDGDQHILDLVRRDLHIAYTSFNLTAFTLLQSSISQAVFLDRISSH